jgi:nifR3 family TIM-barrel protein
MNFSALQLYAAPLAGISDNAFRTLCKMCGADVVLSEMVSAAGICHNSEKTKRLLHFDAWQRPIGIQLFGADPAVCAQAAAYVAETAAPDFIDINAGCPVPKVVKKNGGAALLRDLDLLEKIIAAVVAAVHIPVTVKIRSGWRLGEWVDTECARIAEAQGAAAVFLHPRTRSMGFSGQAMWERIAITKAHTNLPVIGNGDIRNGRDALKMRADTGCDGIMIGRAAFGSPWVFRDAAAALHGHPPPPAVSRADMRAASLQHLALHMHYAPEPRLQGSIKRQLAWYVREVPNAATLRNTIFHAHSYAELAAVVREL